MKTRLFLLATLLFLLLPTTAQALTSSTFIRSYHGKKICQVTVPGNDLVKSQQFQPGFTVGRGHNLSWVQTAKSETIKQFVHEAMVQKLGYSKADVTYLTSSTGTVVVLKDATNYQLAKQVKGGILYDYGFTQSNSKAVAQNWLRSTSGTVWRTSMVMFQNGHVVLAS